MLEDLAPIVGILTIFGGITAMVVLPSYFKSKERREMLATLRAAIEKGQPVPPEMIDAMTRNVKVAPTALGDLRTGIIWVAVGVGVATFGYFVSYEEADAFHPMLGMGAIPGVVGLTYIVLSFFNPNKSKQP
jgi:hypothetical protein